MDDQYILRRFVNGEPEDFNIQEPTLNGQSVTFEFSADLTGLNLKFSIICPSGDECKLDDVRAGSPRLSEDEKSYIFPHRGKIEL